MKIIRMKKKRAHGEKDMFAVLCLVQSAAVIMIILTLFAFTKINTGAISGIRSELSVIFGSDLDMGGYFTPSEVNTQAALVLQTVGLVNSSDDEILIACSFSEAEESETQPAATAVMPVSGIVTSDYGYREHPVYTGESFHSGRDIAAEEGSPVYAVTDGVVTEAGEAEMAGKYIKLLHTDGRETLYCHCSELLVTAGDSVLMGDVIALVGQTGLATGPHLHFELHENGETIDPEIILGDAVNVY